MTPQETDGYFHHLKEKLRGEYEKDIDIFIGFESVSAGTDGEAGCF